MKTREETAVEFAKAMGWKCGGTPTTFAAAYEDATRNVFIRLPPADAQLPDALAFVGHVVGALGFREFAIESPTYSRGDVLFRVTLWSELYEEADTADAPDLSRAAMLAAISAKRGAL